MGTCGRASEGLLDTLSFASAIEGILDMKNEKVHNSKSKDMAGEDKKQSGVPR